MDRPEQQPQLLPISHGAGGHGQRILASLEHGAAMAPGVPRRALKQLDSWILGVSTLVIVLAVFAWAVRDHAISTPRQQPSLAATLRPAAPSTPATRSAEPLSQAASIINEASAPAPYASSVPASDTLPRPATPGSGLASAQAASAAPVVAAEPAAAALPVSAAPQAPARRGQLKAAGGRPTSAAPQPVVLDTDVTLLTALVAHAAQPAVVRPERSHDVVERRDGDSSAALLVRCAQLGLIEGMLCRSRICAGRWDQDAACRAPQH